MSSVNGTGNLLDNKGLILPTATPLATGSRPQRQKGQQLTVDFERILENEEHKWLRVTTAYLEACEKEWSVQDQLQKERDSLNQKHKCFKVDLRRIEGEIDVLAGAKMESLQATCVLYQETRPAGNEATLDLIFREVMDGYEEVNSLKNERENIRARIATVEEQKVVKEKEIRAQEKKYDDVTTCCNAFEELRSITETHSDEISNAQSTEVKNSCMENARDWLKRVQEMRNDMNSLLKWINEWKSGDEAALEEIPLVLACKASGIPVNIFETLDRNDKRTSSDESKPSKKTKKPKYSDISIVATDPSLS